MLTYKKSRFTLMENLLFFIILYTMSCNIWSENKRIFLNRILHALLPQTSVIYRYPLHKCSLHLKNLPTLTHPHNQIHNLKNHSHRPQLK